MLTCALRATCRFAAWLIWQSTPVSRQVRGGGAEERIVGTPDGSWSVGVLSVSGVRNQWRLIGSPAGASPMA